MSKRLCRSIALAVVATLLIAVPVLAGYYGYLRVGNTGSNYTQLALNLTLDIDYLVSQHYVSPSGLDTRVTDAGYTVLPHMLAQDRILWVSDLGGNSTTEFIFFTQQEPLDSFPLITGHGGYVTVPDSNATELGDMYGIVVVGYVNTDAGTNKTIINKLGAVTLNVTGSKQITFAITGGSSLVANNVSSGVMTIIIISDGIDAWMTIDTDIWDEVEGVEVDRESASMVPNTDDDWVLFENNVMPYVYDFEIYKA